MAADSFMDRNELEIQCFNLLFIKVYPDPTMTPLNSKELDQISFLHFHS